MSVLGYPKGSALEFLDGTLKLRHCTTLFTMRFPQLEMEAVKGSLLLLVISWVRVVRWVNGFGKPGRHVQVYLLMLHPTPRRWKRLRSPPSEGVGGEVGVPRNLFPRVGVG